MGAAARVLGGVLAAGAGCLTYASLIERRWYATRHETLRLLRGDRPLRVLFFSDLHYAPGQAHRLEYVRAAVEQWHPDLLVSGGDNLEHPEAIDPVVRLHEQVVATTGVAALAVLGAHDRYGPTLSNPAQYLRGPSNGPRGVPLDVDRLVSGLRGGGWTVLQNDTTTVPTPSGSLEIVGVDDPHIDRDDLSVVPPASVDTGADVTLRLGLVHAPYLRVLEAYDAAGMDLALAGHTHGGQLAVPGWGALVSNSDLPAAQAKGTSRVGADMALHVSAGLGHSIYFPFRFACRPELTVLDLLPRD